jgi:hypothetical protein
MESVPPPSQIIQTRPQSSLAISLKHFWELPKANSLGLFEVAGENNIFPIHYLSKYQYLAATVPPKHAKINPHVNILSLPQRLRE